MYPTVPTNLGKTKKQVTLDKHMFSGNCKKQNIYLKMLKQSYFKTKQVKLTASSTDQVASACKVSNRQENSEGFF